MLRSTLQSTELVVQSRIRRLHHVTASVDDAQDDLDFCVETLGMRLVKKTVNMDRWGSEKNRIALPSRQGSQSFLAKPEALFMIL